jgi:hypothetical protein
MFKGKKGDLKKRKFDLILKFRTITTLLHHLQPNALVHEARTTAVSPLDQARRDRYDLRCLTALATILVRNREVTAVVGGGIGLVLEFLVALDVENPLNPIIATRNPRFKPPRTEFTPKSAEATSMGFGVAVTSLPPGRITYIDPLAFVGYTTVYVPYVTPLPALN